MTASALTLWVARAAIVATALLPISATAQEMPEASAAFDCAASALVARNVMRNLPSVETAAGQRNETDMTQTMVAFLFIGAEESACDMSQDDALAEVNNRRRAVQDRHITFSLEANSIAGMLTDLRAEVDACVAQFGPERIAAMRAALVREDRPCAW